MCYLLGILNGRHVFTQKFVTAIIIDESNRAFFVPIKNPVGDYFLADINHQVFAFKVNRHIYTYRHTLAKSFQFIVYHTSHYEPISADTDGLKEICQEMRVTRLNAEHFNLLKFLSFKENATEKSKDFVPHDLLEIIDILTKRKDAEEKPSKDLINLIAFCKELPFKKIVTPVQPITDFIEDTLQATDPRFIGSLSTTLSAVDFEHKKTSNTPINAKKPMMKLALLVILITGVGLLGYLGYEEGWFNDIIPTGIIPGGIELDGFSPPTPPTQEELVYQQYPNPVDLKAAVEAGIVNVEDLPDDIRELLKDIEIATAPLPGLGEDPIIVADTTHDALGDVIESEDLEELEITNGTEVVPEQ